MDAAAHGKATPDATFDFARNFPLQLEDIIELLLEGVAPNLGAVVCAHEINGNPDAIARAADRAV
jgi:hypothetical protein